jgi:hypothetical protein
MVAALLSRPVGRPKSESKLKTPDDTTRVPVRLSASVQREIRKYCLIDVDRPIEVVLGEWLEERWEEVKRSLPRRKQ